MKTTGFDAGWDGKKERRGFYPGGPRINAFKTRAGPGKMPGPVFRDGERRPPVFPAVGLSNILYSQGSKESSEFFFRREPAKGTHR